MAFYNHRARYDQTSPKNHLSGTSDPKGNIVILGIFFAVGLLFLLPLFPPFGLVWCFVIGKSLFKELQMQGVVKKNVEGKYTLDKNKAKSVSQRSFDEVRAYSTDAAKKYKTRVSESDRMDEKQPYKHPHTPVNYSYDDCAMERRLEQIKSLKDAGILDEKEYQERKRRIMAGK